MLCAARLINQQGDWAGGSNTTLVQVGDLVDRGDDSREVMELMMRLQAQAPRGRVVQLLGNHEVMNLVGDVRYVSPTEVARWGGHAARAAAFSAEGRYGKWLASLPIAAVVGDTLFVHAGIDQTFAKLGIAPLNKLASRGLQSLMRGKSLPSGSTRARILYNPSGPLWSRAWLECELGEWAGNEGDRPNDWACNGCADLKKSLARLGPSIRRMVLGHTPSSTNQPTVVKCPSHGVELIGADVGIVFGGRAAIEIVPNSNAKEGNNGLETSVRTITTEPQLRRIDSL